MMAIGLVALSTLRAFADSGPSQIERWLQPHEVEILSEFVDLLAIPNVAADMPNIRRNADLIMAMMARRGLSPQLLEVPDHSTPPAIVGEWRVAGAERTLVLYAHYDGQPVIPEDWQGHAPFVPVLRSGRLDKGGKILRLPASGDPIDPKWRIYARSSSDDKAGVMAILAAIDALRAVGETPSYNLKVFFDGEEEAGSPNLATILKTHLALLKSDGWIIFDGPASLAGTPQVALGVRGDVHAEIVVYGPARPLHSGHYGNWAPNPAMLLSRLLASMKDDQGHVTIDGFYDDVAPLTDDERIVLANVPRADDQLRADLGLGWTEGNGRALSELLQEPSLNINGFRAADVGERSRNVIPATATAEIDLRLVKGNDYVRQVNRLVRHIEKQGFKVLDREPTIEDRRSWPHIAMVKRSSGYNAERTPLSSPLARGVIAAVRLHGAADVLPSMGGSLPLHVLHDMLGAPSVTLSLANPDNNQHAEDENIRLGNFWRAIEIAAAVMTTTPPTPNPSPTGQRIVQCVLH